MSKISSVSCQSNPATWNTHQDCELLEEPKEKRDSLLQKLRQRIKERDRALEVKHTHTHTHTHTQSKVIQCILCCKSSCRCKRVISLYFHHNIRLFVFIQISVFVSFCLCSVIFRSVSSPSSLYWWFFFKLYLNMIRKSSERLKINFYHFFFLDKLKNCLQLHNYSFWNNSKSVCLSVNCGRRKFIFDSDNFHHTSHQ